jgi:hypothetical protein
MNSMRLLGFTGTEKYIPLEKISPKYDDALIGFLIAAVGACVIIAG